MKKSKSKFILIYLFIAIIISLAILFGTYYLLKGNVSIQNPSINNSQYLTKDGSDSYRLVVDNHYVENLDRKGALSFINSKNSKLIETYINNDKIETIQLSFDDIFNRVRRNKTVELRLTYSKTFGFKETLRVTLDFKNFVFAYIDEQKVERAYVGEDKSKFYLFVENILNKYNNMSWYNNIALQGDEIQLDKFRAQNIDISNLYASLKKNNKIRYIVRFDENGGNLSPTTERENEVYEGKTIRIPDIPYKKGYRFDKWVLKANKETFDFANPIFSDVELEATWVLETYSANFTNNINPTFTFNYESEDILVPNATKKGYDFDGYEINNDGSRHKDYVIKHNTVGNIEFRAHFSPKSYKINYKYFFYEKDGSYKEFDLILQNIHIKSEARYETQYVLNQTDPLVRETDDQEGIPNGYIFDKYYTKLDDGSFIVKQQSGIYRDDKDIVVYKKYISNNYTLTFNLNSEGEPTTPATIDPITRPRSTAIVLPADPVRKGYIFKGWKKGRLFVQSPYLGHKDELLVAEWEKEKYTLTFNPKGGSWSVNTFTHVERDNEGEVVYQISRLYQQIIQTAPFTQREGYNFEGWFILKDGQEVKLFDVHNLVVEENLYIYAKWTPKTFIIKYKYEKNNDGDLSEKDINEAYSDTFSLYRPNIAYQGKRFLGWTIEGEDENLVINDFNLYRIPFNKQVVLKAKWGNNEYVVTVDTKGGSKIDPLIIQYNNLITQPLDTQKLGQELEGWYFDKEYNQKVDLNTYLVTSDITIHAKWQNIRYTIEYDLQGGTLNETNPDSYDIETKATIHHPTLTGNDFIGWTIENKTTIPNPLINLYKGYTGNIKLIANFVPHIYNVTFLFEDENGVQKSNTIKIPYDVELTLPEIQRVKPGFEFKGWYYFNEQTRERIDHTKYNDTENIVLQAKIIPIQYSVLFLDTTGNKIAEFKVDANDTIIDEDYREKAVLPGNKFNYWGNLNGDRMSFPYTVTSDITFMANTYPNTYRIRYYFDESSFEEDNITFGSYVYAKSLTTPTGYTNLGWYLYNKDTKQFLDKQLNSTYIYPNDIYVRQKLVRQTYYVTYELDGGVFIDDLGQEIQNPNLKVKYSYGDTIKKINNAKKDGYEFSHWNVNYNRQVILPYPVTDNIIITAVWTNRNYTYTLVNEFRNTVSESTIYGNNLLTLSNDSDIDGYSFLYWYYIENGKEIQFRSDLYKFGKNVTFYAKYRKQRYLIKFYGPKDTKTIKENNAFDYILYDYKNFYEFEEKIIPPTPVQIQDMEFVGWSDSRDNGYSTGNKVSNYPSFPVIATQNKTYYAVYKPVIWKITYIYLNGANQQVETQTVNGGSYTNLRLLSSANYRQFKGWALEEDEDNYQLLDQVLLYNFGRDITLYAKWLYKTTLIRFSNHYNNNVQTVAYIDLKEYKRHPDYQTNPDHTKLSFDFVKDKPYRVTEASKFYPAAKPLKEEDMLYPVIDGFELVGYYNSSRYYEYIKIDFNNFRVYSEITIVPMLKRRSFTLYFHFQDQEDEGRNNQERVVVSKGISNSSTYTSINPTRFRYRFKNWTFEKGNPNGPSFNSNDFKKYGDEVHLYAVWTKQEYSINYNNMSDTDYYLASPVGLKQQYLPHKNKWSGVVNKEKYNITTFTEDDEIDLSGLVPIHAYKTFTYWSINGEKVTKIERGQKSNITLTANFVDNPVYFKIKYKKYRLNPEDQELSKNVTIDSLNTAPGGSIDLQSDYVPMDQQSTGLFFTEKGLDPKDLEKQYFFDRRYPVRYFIMELYLKGIGKTQDNPIVLVPIYTAVRTNDNARRVTILYEQNQGYSIYDGVALVKNGDDIVSRGTFISPNYLSQRSNYDFDGYRVTYKDGTVKEFKGLENYEFGQEFAPDGTQLIEETMVPLYKPFEYDIYFKGKDNLPYTLIFNDQTIEVEDGREYKYTVRGAQYFLFPEIKIKGYNTNVNYTIRDVYGNHYTSSNSSSSIKANNDLYVYFDNVVERVFNYRISFSVYQNSNSDYTYSPNSNFKYELKYNKPFKTPDYDEISLGVVGYEIEGYILNFANPNPVEGRHKNFFLPGTEFIYTQEKDLDMKVLIKEEVFGFRVHTNGGTYRYYNIRNNVEYEGFEHSYDELVQDPSLEEEKIIWFTSLTYRYNFLNASRPGYNFSKWGLPYDQNADRESFNPNDSYFNSSRYVNQYRYELHNVPKVIYRDTVPNISEGHTTSRKVVILDIFAVWTPKNPSVYLDYSNINSKYTPNATTRYTANYGSIHQFPFTFYYGYKYLGWRILGTNDGPKFKFFVGSRKENPDQGNLDDYIYITENTKFEVVFEKSDQTTIFTDSNIEYILDNDNNFIKIPSHINSIAQIYKNEDGTFDNIKKAVFKNDVNPKFIYPINGYSYNDFYYSNSNSSNGTIYQNNIVGEESLVKIRDYKKTYNIIRGDVPEGTYNLTFNFTSYSYGYEYLIPDAILENYEFMGWIYEEVTESNINIDDYKNPQKSLRIKSNQFGNITIKPVFRPLTMTIVYNLGYEDINNPNPQKNIIEQQVNATEPQIFLLQPKRRGYTFSYWRRGGNSYTIAYSGTRSEKLYFVANWVLENYTISYNLAGANSVSNNTNYNVRSSFDLTNPKKDGSIFKGWLSSYEENGKTDGKVPELDFRFRPYDEQKPFDHLDNKYSRIGNLTLVAVFEEIKYNLTFNYNFSGSPLNKKLIGYGEQFVAPDVQRNGFTIEYWTYKGTNYYPGSEYRYNFLYDIELIASWSKQTYTVAFNNEINLDYKKEYGHDNYGFKYGDFIREPELPDKNEYVVRWYNQDIPDETIQFPYKVVKNITITFEKAKRRHSIYYDLDGGVNSEFNPTSYSLSDLNATNIRIENPTKYGYRFLGWSYEYDKALNKQLRINAEQVFGPLLIQAHWQPIYNRVTYDTLYNEEKYIYDQIEYDGFAENKQIQNPEGYKFIHWYETEPSVPFDFSRPILKNTNLKAYYHRYEIVEKIIYTRNKPTEVAILFNRFIPYLENTSYSRNILNRIFDNIEVINGRKPYNVYGKDNNKLVLVFEPNAIAENMIITLNKNLPIYSGQNYQVGLLKGQVRIAYFNQSFVSYVKAKNFTVEIEDKNIEQKEEKVLTITIKEANATVTPIFKFRTQEERNKVEIILYASIKQLNQFQYIIKQKENGNSSPLDIEFSVELPELSQKETINVTLK